MLAGTVDEAVELWLWWLDLDSPRIGREVLDSRVRDFMQGSRPGGRKVSDVVDITRCHFHYGLYMRQWASMFCGRSLSMR